MVVTFELNGRKFMGLNGGPKYKFTEAVSLVVECDTQEEIDHYWNRLLDGGEESRCGWLKDRFARSSRRSPGACASESTTSWHAASRAIRAT